MIAPRSQNKLQDEKTTNDDGEYENHDENSGHE